jgi:hypothetical protein
MITDLFHVQLFFDSHRVYNGIGFDLAELIAEALKYYADENLDENDTADNQNCYRRLLAHGKAQLKKFASKGGSVYDYMGNWLTVDVIELGCDGDSFTAEFMSGDTEEHPPDE